MKKIIAILVLCVAAIVAVNAQAPNISSWGEATIGSTLVPPENTDTEGSTTVVPFVNLAFSSNAGPVQAWMGFGSQIVDKKPQDFWVAGNLGYMLVAPEDLDGFWFKPYASLSLTNGFQPGLGVWMRYSVPFTDKKDIGLRVQLDTRYAFGIEMDGQDEDIWQLVFNPQMEIYTLRDKRGNDLSIGMSGSIEVSNHVYNMDGEDYNFTNWTLGGYFRLPGATVGMNWLNNGWRGEMSDSGNFSPDGQFQIYAKVPF